jgi:hypothetical protein
MVAFWVIKPLGAAIVGGIVAGWIGGAVEKTIKMRPV